MMREFVTKTKMNIAIGLLSAAFSQTTFAVDEDITINFQLQSPIAFSAITAGNLGILKTTLITATGLDDFNNDLVYGVNGSVTWDFNDNFLSGTVTQPSVGITGDSGAVIAISIAETSGDTSGLDFLNFDCDHDGVDTGTASTGCDSGDGYSITATGSVQTLVIGYKVEGDAVENASPTLGANTSSITVSAVYQ